MVSCSFKFSAHVRPTKFLIITILNKIFCYTVSQFHLIFSGISMKELKKLSAILYHFKRIISVIK